MKTGLVVYSLDPFQSKERQTTKSFGIEEAFLCSSSEQN
jgi:hypothetical protein